MPHPQARAAVIVTVAATTLISVGSAAAPASAATFWKNKVEWIHVTRTATHACIRSVADQPQAPNDTSVAGRKEPAAKWYHGRWWGNQPRNNRLTFTIRKRGGKLMITERLEYNGQRVVYKYRPVTKRAAKQAVGGRVVRDILMADCPTV